MNNLIIKDIDDVDFSAYKEDSFDMKHVFYEVNLSGLMNTYDVKLKIFSNYDEKLFFISPGNYEMSVIGIFDEENITASLEKGVLTVIFPNKNREIPINIESK